jgi:hypothetical protein
MKGWLYWSLVGMLGAVIIGALVVITSRALAGPMGPAGPTEPTRAAGLQPGNHTGVVDRYAPEPLIHQVSPANMLVPPPGEAANPRGASLTGRSPAPPPAPP